MACFARPRGLNRFRAVLWPVCLSASTVFSASGVTLTNQPLADTYSETYGSEDKNYGSAPALRIDQWGGRQAFLRFPLTNLPKDKRVLSATLRLSIAEVGFNEQGEFPDLKTCVGIYDVVTPWTENGLTHKSPDGERPWNQGPGIPGGKYGDVGPLPEPDIGVRLRQSAIPLESTSLKKNAWLELDLTALAREMLLAGEKEMNLVLRSSTLSRNYTFHSREAVRTELRPQLVLEVAEALPTIRLESTVALDWHRPGQVQITAWGLTTTNSGLLRKTWRLEQKPATSKADDSALAATAAGASLRPDVSGRYRVRLDVETGGAAGQRTSESLDVFALSLRPHPRLYVTPESLNTMRDQAKSGARLTKAFLEWVDRGSRTADQGKFHDMGIHDGCENTSLAWLITGDRRHLTNSIAYAQRILQKPMREHFEDVHAATFLGAAWVHAMALHYDWCYDQLSPEHRKTVSEWLKEAASWAWVRSGAPIAHNDGGARQCLLGSAALALLGDDPEGAELFRRSHQNFTRNLLPWLNDGGQGGRSGDGGEYEGLHAFYIVRYAWMSQTATGEDVFSESPFFFNRLNHILFGWYPRPLVERNGAFSMRQYYSPSGDHIRMGYVGDTQPYQSAAALCARYRSTPEAQAVRWLAGQWPTAWMQYTLRWAVLGDFENIPATPPRELAFLDRGCNTAYLRSDWSDDATWILFENAPYVSAHGSLDSGTFEIFKGDILAARTGNLDHANVGASHTMNYLHRTIAGNCLLILDPEEKWKGFLGGAEGSQDGGGQRTNFPLGSSPDAETYLAYRDIYQRGRITGFKQDAQWAYAAADLTPAYNNPRIHGGKLNRPKVKSVRREMLYLRNLDSVVVFDRISALEPEFRKTWLLHSLGDLDVLDGKETKVDDGEFRYSGATRALIRYGWPKPVSSFGRCLSVTLLPENPLISRIGGRVALPKGQAEGFPGDQWHGKHEHRHLKDFWVNGTNYPPGNPPESRWFGEPGSGNYVEGTADETGGRGRWRIEVSPSVPARDDVFLHVLCPRLGNEGGFPTVSRIAAPEHYAGGMISQDGLHAAFFFCKELEGQQSFNTTLQDSPETTCFVTGLAKGSYLVETGNRLPIRLEAGDDGLLVIEKASGVVSIQK